MCIISLPAKQISRRDSQINKNLFYIIANFISLLLLKTFRKQIKLMSRKLMHRPTQAKSFSNLALAVSWHCWIESRPHTKTGVTRKKKKYMCTWIENNDVSTWPLFKRCVSDRQLDSFFTAQRLLESFRMIPLDAARNPEIELRTNVNVVRTWWLLSSTQKEGHHAEKALVCTETRKNDCAMLSLDYSKLNSYLLVAVKFPTIYLPSTKEDCARVEWFATTIGVSRLREIPRQQDKIQPSTSFADQI